METIAPDQLDVERLFLGLSRAHHQLMGLLQRKIEKISGDQSLQPGMLHLYCTLAREDGQTVSQLATQLRMAKSSVTGAIQRMEGAGLVRLELDPSDLRRKRVTLSSAGREMKVACEGVQSAVRDRMAEEFDPSEYVQLLSLLDRLGAAASEREYQGTSSSKQKAAS